MFPCDIDLLSSRIKLYLSFLEAPRSIFEGCIRGKCRYVREQKRSGYYGRNLHGGKDTFWL